MIVHFLPKKHCFDQKALILPKVSQKVRKSQQILLSRQKSVCHPAFKSPCFISSNIEFQPDRVFLFKGCSRIHYRLIAWLGGETFAFCSWHWNIGEIPGATSYTENTTNHIVNELCFKIKGLREPGFDIALRVFIGAKSSHCLALSVAKSQIGLVETWMMQPWQVKMPTQYNFLKLSNLSTTGKSVGNSLFQLSKLSTGCQSCNSCQSCQKLVKAVKAIDSV